MENDEYRRKKLDELQKRLADAYSSIHHIELVRALCFMLIYMFIIFLAYGQNQLDIIKPSNQLFILYISLSRLAK